MEAVARRAPATSAWRGAPALTKLTVPADFIPDLDDDLDLATAYRADLAAAEIAQALIETGRAVGFLHLLVTALDGRGYRRGYAEGAMVAGRVCHAVARDAKIAGG